MLVNVFILFIFIIDCNEYETLSSYLLSFLFLESMEEIYMYGLEN